MARLQEIQGIVLTKRKHKERDFLVKIFLEEYGKMMFYVRGSKNPNFHLKHVIQPFTQAIYIADIKDSGLSFLRDAKNVENFSSLKLDIFKNAYATYICGLVDACMEDRVASPALFNQLTKGLALIDQDVDPEVITNIFEIKLLYYFGVMPEFRACVVCGRTKGAFDYSSKYHGLLCSEHFYEDERRLHAHPRAIYLIRKFSMLNLNNIGKISVKEETKKDIRYVIDILYDELVGIHLKSKTFIDQMKDWGQLLMKDDD